MKTSFFTFFFIIVVFSAAFGNETTAEDAYELAEKYEEENKTEEALFWYKQAAQDFKDSSDDLRLKLEESLIGKSYYDDEEFTIEEADYIESFTSEYENNETKDTVTQMMGSLFGITTYESNYVLPITHDFKSHKDRKHTETVFQISLKKDLLKNFFNFDEAFGVAYTQRSWWQIIQESAPFRETNYRPEVYMIMPHIDKNSILKAYKFGFLHESNGQGDERSRSWNRLYFDLFFQYKGFFVNPRVWYRLKEHAQTDDNRDIVKYMGYGDLTFMYPYKEHLFRLMIRNNLDFDYNIGAVQFDWTFPLAKSGVFGYVQYFDGYGESLADYNKWTRRIGIGLAISR
ncbi:MAG: phospholipase A [Campylobacteraceae bacterium]|jgi:phospholipase A1|nr:phospholipase A [Campylobacteraceae bacterium]